MSKLTIHTFSEGLDSINLMESKCIFKFNPTFGSDENSSTINSNNGCTTITFKDGGNYDSIQTNNGIITINSNAAKSTIIKTEKVSIVKNDFEITYDKQSGLKNTVITYDSGIIVEISNNKMDITVFGNHLEFESKDSIMVMMGSEIIIDSPGNSVTEIMLEDKQYCNPPTLKLNNYSSCLETITVNTDTIFNNQCTHSNSRVNTINIYEGVKFVQTGNDLFIDKLVFEKGGKIEFTHNKNKYKFINLLSKYNLKNTTVIKDLNDFLEKVKSFSTNEDYLKNWTDEHDYPHMASFVIQNQGCDGVPSLGNIEHANE